MFREGALELEAVGGQVYTDASDSSDSVNEGVERCLFKGFSAAETLVAAFRFGLLGVSTITMDVDGISIGTEKSLVTSAGGFGGAVITVRFGFVGIRTRRARVTFECIEEIALLSLFSVFHSFASFYFFPGLFFMVRNKIFSNFPVGVFGRRFAYNCNSVWRSAFVPNLAKSELRMVTSLFPGSFITAVNLSVFTTEEPGANTSYSPTRIFLEHFNRGLFFASLISREASVRGTDSPTSG